MPLPVNVDTCTVTGVYVKLDGTACTGTVTFTPVPARLLDATADPPTTILGTPIVATLVDGAVDVDLPATDDTDLNPVDWAYHVSVRLGADDAYSFCMEAPAGSVDLTDVTPIFGTEGNPIVAGPPGEGVPAGGTTGDLLVKASGDDYDYTWTPLDTDLATIAALAPGSDAVIQRKVGMWVASTPTEYKADLNLTKSDVGLGNVTNTSDAAKPVSTAQQTALNLKVTNGGGVATIRSLSQAAYDALSPPDPNTMYVITS